MYDILKNSWHLIGSLTSFLVIPYKVSLFIAFLYTRVPSDITRQYVSTLSLFMLVVCPVINFSCHLRSSCEENLWGKKWDEQFADGMSSFFSSSLFFRRKAVAPAVYDL